MGVRRRKAIVDAAGMITPLGDLEQTWSGLQQGKCGLRTVQYPGLPTYPMGTLCPDPAIPPAGDWPRLQSILEPLLATIPEVAPETPLLLSTTKGAADELRASSCPRTGQPWNLGAWLCGRLGIEEKPICFSAACSSGSVALARGAMEIVSGRRDQVLVIGVDLLSEFVVRGFDSLKALSPTGARPFDRYRDGLSLGEAAAWVLLREESVATGQQFGDPSVEIRSWGISCDAHHITAPSRAASGLKRALQRIHEFSPEGLFVGGINGHGTGTLYNDSMELLAFAELMPEVRVCSTKGALGHSLGATGVVEAVVSMRSLQSGKLPPTVGCEDAEDEVVSVNHSSLLTYPSILTTNSGFGGINCALLLTLN